MGTSIADKKKILKKIAESSVSGGGNNIRDSRGRLVVKKLALEDGFKGSRFVAEFIVVGSNKVHVTSLKTGNILDIAPHTVGEEVSWVQMLDEHDSAFGNVKGFILELFGEKEASNDEIFETLTRICGLSDDPKDNVDCSGMAVDYDTYRKVTRANQIEITLIKWKHVEQEDGDVSAMRKWMTDLFTGKGEAKA